MVVHVMPLQLACISAANFCYKETVIHTLEKTFLKLVQSLDDDDDDDHLGTELNLFFKCVGAKHVHFFLLQLSKIGFTFLDFLNLVTQLYLATSLNFVHYLEDFSLC
jgi:hypothetical protein